MLRFGILTVLVGALLSGCGRDKPSGKVADKTPPPPAADPCAKAEAKGPLKWFEDDYDGAVACAKQKKLPIAIDLWAPWCHTCISMQTTVFMDPAMKDVANKFVFLAMDTDREQNAAAVGKFAPSAMPTFYVIKDDETVLARFVGAATLPEFLQFLDSGERAKIGGMAAADVRLNAAERALAKRDLETADQELTAALEIGPTAWMRRNEVIAYLQMTKSKRGDHKACVDLSEKYMDMVGQTAIATNFWSTAIECAAKIETEDKVRAKAIHERATAKLQKLLDQPDSPLSVDDRAEALGYLRDAYDHAGKKKEATAAAEKLRAVVDDGWTKAATPLARMTFLWPRAEAYAYLKRPLDLVADYEKIAAELPTEYEPRARLGWLYMKAAKFPEAAKWTDEALTLVYGPRKGRVLAQRADIAAGASDKAAERKFREQAVKLWESLPAGQQSPDNLAKAKAALAALDAPPAPPAPDAGVTKR